ncbi:hypothetical protein BBK36DRAFT_1134930 [Trichoderma citrinoviride]|uniref:Uncharacterized protein n=1 Tax=Trichoderma citrinoviride TaxID=58853 RepID=A0A2T4BGE1_9HYPO|nr:hypothetical protein BBK36DRAFT_1134930 [Trichoderma citrinoviride]PTB68393.1 hypothetical protein BBK36DRAFT_1134930 [Trichoderma citrinoviride]
MEKLDIVPPETGSRPSSRSSLQCCCGSPDCVNLKNNCSVLEAVEKDVRTAAQLGKALLARHEAYMADAERDRLQLNARIERLQLDKQQLEADNAAKVEENNELLDQLEILNSTVFDSDAKIRSLEASLLSSQQAIRRLESAAARAAEADQHLKILEEEQDKLTGELQASKAEARSHAQRFKEAQRGILDMQDQLERMEKEALLERQRHDEMMEKLERQREVEKHLDAAAVRLKGAAASKSITEQRQGNKIVGHFVRDLLQDNANLQLGIAELREMLITSNDEIQVLREQLMFHQPLSDGPNPVSNLKAELEPSLFESARPSQEFHIHHHYHVTPKQEARKPKKKRHGLLPGIFTPPATISRSSSPGPWSQRRLVSSPTGPVLSRTGETTPITASSAAWHEFSTPSELSSSLPTSPRLFDHSGTETDSLMSPTTSYDPTSPTWRASHRKRPSAASSCSFQSLSIIDFDPGTTVQTQNPYRLSSGIIHEEDEDVHSTTPTTKDAQDEPADSKPTDTPTPGPRLRRVPSHESIMSLSGGLDIHTLQIRPSQMTLRPLGGADAVLSDATAQPTLSTNYSKRSDAVLRDNFAGLLPKRSSTPTSDMSGSSQASRTAGGLGKWVGWRPWGGESQSLPRAAEKERKIPQRAPGINQPGAIPGFQQYWALQQRRGGRTTAEAVDHSSLSEILQETATPA